MGRLRPLIMNESFARMRNEELGMRNGGAAHKNMEAPRSIEISLKAFPLGEGGARRAGDRLPRRGRILQNEKQELLNRL